MSKQVIFLTQTRKNLNSRQLRKLSNADCITQTSAENLLNYLSYITYMPQYSSSLMESIKLIQLAILFLFGLYFAFVSFENIVNYDVNFVYVKHVLSMDTTYGVSLWKSVGDDDSWLYHLTFFLIIIVEMTSTGLCWLGFAQMMKNFKSNFNQAKQYGIAGIGTGMLLFVLFLIIAGEWFLMWQSPMWNALDTAYGMIAVLGVMLLILLKDEKSHTCLGIDE